VRLEALQCDQKQNAVADAVVDEVFALLGCYTAYVGSCLLTFQDSLWLLPSRVKQSKPPEDGIDRLSQNVGRWVTTHKSEDLIYTIVEA
jgi:hypothetical protein